MIRTFGLAGCALGALLLAGAGQARNTTLKLPINNALTAPAAKERLSGEVKFFFGSQQHPKPAATYGTYTAHRKTNFANKSDREGCEWAFLSAMLVLQQRALAEGGNAVVNIHSYYRKNEFSSETEYECHAGAIIGGVALRGTVVKL